MNATWQKRALLAAAGWNVIGGASALFDPTGHFAQLFNGALAMDDPVQRFFYQCVWINVMAWGIGYAIAAYLPASRTAVLTAGGLGKVVYFLASFSAFDAGAAKVGLVAAGALDLAWAALFAWIVLKGRTMSLPTLNRPAPGNA